MTPFSSNLTRFYAIGKREIILILNNLDILGIKWKAARYHQGEEVDGRTLSSKREVRSQGSSATARSSRASSLPPKIFKPITKESEGPPSLTTPTTKSSSMQEESQGARKVIS